MRTPVYSSQLNNKMKTVKYIKESIKGKPDNYVTEFLSEKQVAIFLMDIQIKISTGASTQDIYKLIESVLKDFPICK